MAVSSVSGRQMPIGMLSLEKEEYINIVIFVYWQMLIALKNLYSFFLKQ